MKHVKRLAGILVSFALVGITIFYMYKNGAGDNKKSMEYIKATVKANGKIVEGFYKIGVQTKDDIRWYYKGKDVICIQYGNVLLKYDMKSFVSDEVQNDLNYIGISTKQNEKTLRFKLYYWGEELTEYAETSFWDVFKFWE